MRTNPQPAEQVQPRKARPLTPFTFRCTACETVEHRRTPMLPEGWATEEVNGDIYAYCGDCAADLPHAADGASESPVQ